MTSKQRKALEDAADQIELAARDLDEYDRARDLDGSSHDRKELFMLAWRVKQIARKGTASEGI